MAAEEISKDISERIHTTTLLLRLVQALLSTLIVLPTFVSIRQCLISYSKMR